MTCLVEENKKTLQFDKANHDKSIPSVSSSWGVCTSTITTDVRKSGQKQWVTQRRLAGQDDQLGVRSRT